MSYSDGEVLIAAQVAACVSLTAPTVARGNWNVLNKGKARVYAILRPGPFERNQHSLGGLGGSQIKYRSAWVTKCEVWVRYKDYGETLTRLQEVVTEVVERFDIWRLAGDTTSTVLDVFARRGGEPEEMWKRGGGVGWLRQTIEIEWQELRSVTLQE